MNDLIELRPHHFMCIPGYKGYNYDEASKNSWDKLTEQLKANPDTKVKIVDGADTLCLKCPNNPSLSQTCNESYVKKLDIAVKKILGLKTGDIYLYSDLNKKIKDLLNPEKHAKICGDCDWRAFGVCTDTFAKITNKIKNAL